MGIKYEDECVQCSNGCVDCGRKRIAVPYCDKCKDDTSAIYEFDGEQLCISCVEKELKEVGA